MNLPAPLHTHRVGHASSDILADAVQQCVPQLLGAADEGDAHHSRPDPKVHIDRAESEDFGSPLWAVAIGTSCLLAAMAAVIALG
jgi:2C-methyl-D-erythritol 2,4-cyclodiphosphate synthase